MPYSIGTPLDKAITVAIPTGWRSTQSTVINKWALVTLITIDIVFAISGIGTIIPNSSRT